MRCFVVVREMTAITVGNFCFPMITVDSMSAVIFFSMEFEGKSRYFFLFVSEKELKIHVVNRLSTAYIPIN